jgi:hypothetical protein
VQVIPCGRRKPINAKCKTVRDLPAALHRASRQPLILLTSRFGLHSLCGIVLQVLAMTGAPAHSKVPVLRYTPPANAFQAGFGSPADYSFTGFNAAVQIYPFRPFTGDIQQSFQMTLLRDWITLQYQEQNVGGPLQFYTTAVAGADLAIIADFLETGYLRGHRRMLIVAGNQAAIVDASAPPQTWQTLAPALDALVSSLRVEAARAPAALTAEAGRAVAGLYKGFAQKYTVDTIRAGYCYPPALHYYLFSEDGRVYRQYDFPPGPGGNIALFDFDAAELSDQQNSGRYTVDGGKLLIVMARQQPETIITDVPRDGVVTIYGAPLRAAVAIHFCWQLS